MSHYIAWNPDQEIAYHAASETMAKALACRKARQGRLATWEQLAGQGWLVLVVEGPADL